jgi:pimeloyl-[acyl-carrier protein] methyl ester esterase
VQAVHEVSQAPARTAFYDIEAKVFARYSLAPRSRVLSLEQPAVRIRALEIGSGEPVLFLHGFSLCTAHWASLLARLPAFRRIAIDMPGHGGSDGVDYEGVDLRRWYQELLTGCLDRLGLDSVHVVGHSQGAMLGLFLALDAPERVRSLVTIGTPAVAFGAHLPSLRVLARRGIGPLLLAMPTIPTDLIRATYLGTQRRGFGRTVSTYLRELFRGADSRPPQYVLRDDELARIRQPVAVLWGRDDARFQAVAEARQRVALMPSARFEVLPGGHAPWLDDLASCADRISRFLSSGVEAARPAVGPS